MLERASGTNRKSQTPNALFSNTCVSRPPAAVVVGALEHSSVTPNQVTFASLGVFAIAAAVLVGWRTWGGLVAAALLDFLMDEVKAFLLVGASSVRLWLQTEEPFWLLLGVAGLFVVATGITLTSFMRRSEYLAATGARLAPDDETTRTAARPAPRSPAAKVV